MPTKPLSKAQLQPKIYKARKLIIVSGGTLSSPLILQRSGIGDPEKLRKVGVKPIVDLPGVGLNFQVCPQYVGIQCTKLTPELGPLPYILYLPRKA